MGMGKVQRTIDASQKAAKIYGHEGKKRNNFRVELKIHIGGR